MSNIRNTGLKGGLAKAEAGARGQSSGLCGDHTAAPGPEARVPARGTGLPEAGRDRDEFQAVST